MDSFRISTIGLISLELISLGLFQLGHFSRHLKTDPLFRTGSSTSGWWSRSSWTRRLASSGSATAPRSGRTSATSGDSATKNRPHRRRRNRKSRLRSRLCRNSRARFCLRWRASDCFRNTWPGPGKSFPTISTASCGMRTIRGTTKNGERSLS